MNYQRFSVEVAREVGVASAVVREVLSQLCRESARFGENERDGRYWAHVSVRKLHKTCPYLSEKQIRTALGRLEDYGYVFSRNYDKGSFDRSKWYSVVK